MSAQKLLHRVIASSESNETPASSGISSVIATDPLTCFAIVYASLVHDVDHTGKWVMTRWSDHSVNILLTPYVI
jgi:hypothetical protein